MMSKILSLMIVAAAALPAGAESLESLSVRASLTLQTSFERGLTLVARRAQAPAGDEVEAKPVRSLPVPAGRPASSTLQEALKRCVSPMVLRPLGGADEFIRYYGRCLTQDAELKIRRLEPGSEPGTLAVYTELAGPAAERLGGVVTARGSNGLVTLRVEVRQERIFRILPVVRK